MRRCKYSEWALPRASIKQNMKTSTNHRTDKNTAKTGSNKKPYIVDPYIQGMSESCKDICRKYGLKCISKEAISSRTS